MLILHGHWRSSMLSLRMSREWPCWDFKPYNVRSAEGSHKLNQLNRSSVCTLIQLRCLTAEIVTSRRHVKDLLSAVTMAGALQSTRCTYTQYKASSVGRLTPFTSSRPHGSSRCSASIKAALQAPQTAQPQQQQNVLDQLRLLVKAAPAAVPMYLLSYLPAVAEEDATVDAAFAAATQSEGATDLIVSVLAALVFGLLVVVTGGVSGAE